MCALQQWHGAEGYLISGREKENLRKDMTACLENTVFKMTGTIAYKLASQGDSNICCPVP